jgi:hypothetical protein
VYYRLKMGKSLTCGYIKKTANPEETLLSGALVDERKLVLPWPYIIVVNENHPLEMSDYYSDVKLMSKRLVSTLQAAGVDNLQTFPAEITHEDTEEVFHDFVAVNVIGMVSAANEGASTTSPLAGRKFFHKLVIDPKRAAGLLMFRLAESLIDIIVEGRVGDALRAGGFRDLVLQPLAEGPAS